MSGRAWGRPTLLRRGAHDGARAVAEDVARLSRRVLTLVVLIAVTVVGGFTAVSVQRDINNEQLQPVQRANNDLLRDMLDAQVGFRGFVATGEEGYLAAPTPTQAQLRASLADLDRRLEDSPERRSMDEAVGQWISFSDKVVATRRAGGDAAAMLDSSPFPRVRLASEQIALAVDDDLRRGKTVVDASLAVMGLLLALELALLVRILLRLRRRVDRQIVQPLQHLRRTVVAHEPGARARTDIGPIEIRALSDVVNTYVDTVERAVADREIEVRLDRVKDNAALGIRRSLSEAAVLGALEEGLLAAFPDARPRVVRPTDPEWVGTTARFDSADEPTARGVVARHGTDTSDDAWLGCIVGPADAPAAAVVVDGPQRAVPWHAREVYLVEQLCEFANRGVAQCRYDAERAQTISRLEELDRHKTDFMATVSHELRTPLSSINGYLELLEDGDYGDLTPEQLETITVIGRNTARLRSLIEDLLVLSRIESTGVELDIAPVRVGRLVDHVVENLRPQAARGDVALVRVAAPEADVVEADAAQVERALTNVIGNAVKFTPPGGKITVEVRPGASRLDIVVTDTGIGIPEADLAAVGRRFFRASNVTAQTIPGTGLGLSIVRAIAEAHHGDLAVASTPGVGTTVTLTLGRAETP